MRRIEAKWGANYWCEEQFWCKVLKLRVHCAIALCSEINWPKEQAPGQSHRKLHLYAPHRASTFSGHHGVSLVFYDVQELAL